MTFPTESSFPRGLEHILNSPEIAEVVWFGVAPKAQPDDNSSSRGTARRAFQMRPGETAGFKSDEGSEEAQLRRVENIGGK